MPAPQPVEPHRQEGATDIGSLVDLGLEDPPPPEPTPEPAPPTEDET